VGLSHLAQALQSGTVLNAGPVDPNVLFHRFFPPHATQGSDPFAAVERILNKIARNRGQVSLVAVPAFIWFSTRLFGGVRTALNEVFDVAVRPPRQRHPVVTYLLGKLRDVAMVIGTMILFLANTVMTAGLAYLQSRGAAVAPEFGFFVSTVGRLMGEALAFAFQLSLFYLVYRFASVRRLPPLTALLAALFTSVLFEMAKRLYGLYLAHFASLEGPSGDAQIGAAVLFVLWVYYTAVVFLLGGVVGETWELRKMQKEQRVLLK
jgi:membrane protein